MGRESHIEKEIRSLFPELLKNAQILYDDWHQDEDGLDEEYGSGGICDKIAQSFSNVLSVHGFEIEDGGQEGDDHAFIFAAKEGEVFSVDIPPYVYEIGSGYSWKKVPNIVFKENHIEIFQASYKDVFGEPYSHQLEGMMTSSMGSSTKKTLRQKPPKCQFEWDRN